MLAYAARRLLTVPLSIGLVLLVSFVLLRVTGDPVDIYLDVNSTPEQRALLVERLHLDRPLAVQFLLFLADVVKGDFGQSLQFGEPALPIVLDRLDATAI